MDKKLKVAVIGGGITGLTSAWRLSGGSDLTNPVYSPAKKNLEVHLFEATSHLGGKIMGENFCDTKIDLGPESILARVPQALGLVEQLDLVDQIVFPTSKKSLIWSKDKLHELPKDTMMGIPRKLHLSSLLPLLSLMSPIGLLRMILEPLVPPTGAQEDISVGDFITKRLGKELVDVLVDPLLAGVYACSSYDLSLAATLPALDNIRKSYRTVKAGIKASSKIKTNTPATIAGDNIFFSFKGGLSTLIDRLQERVVEQKVLIHKQDPVLKIKKSPNGWEIKTQDESFFVDSIVLATPAWQSAKIVEDTSPRLALELKEISYTSVALVSFAYKKEAINLPVKANGFVVSPREGLATTACTWSSQKWPRFGDSEYFILRASVGNKDNQAILKQSDEEIIQKIQTELENIMSISTIPAAVKVSRWNFSLPQYKPAHLNKMKRIEELCKPLGEITIAGSSIYGIGIASCIANADKISTKIISELS